MAPRDEDVSAGSILKELVVNQYQAILAGGAAMASVVTLNPLPFLLWLGAELVLLPILDSGPLRRLVARKRRELARQQAQEARERMIAGLSPPHARRFAEMEHRCRLIEANYQSLTGTSQAYLAEQRRKLDVVLQGAVQRLMALRRYDSIPNERSREGIEREIAELEKELKAPDLNDRAEAALKKNLDLKKKLLQSVLEVDGTVKALHTELDSMESLLEVLHQNSISLRDPQAISEELDEIVRQSEHSERVVREMEALLSGADGFDAQPLSGVALPRSASRTDAGRPAPRSRTAQR
jgi:phage shock protein A